MKNGLSYVPSNSRFLDVLIAGCQVTGAAQKVGK